MNVTGTINEDIYAMRLQQGDELAFRYVMERYFPVITLFARRFISNHAVAEDVAEEKTDVTLLTRALPPPACTI